MKMLVPTGYMVMPTEGGVGIALCPGVAPQQMTAMPGMAHHDPAPTGGHGEAEQPCAFAGLSAPSLAAADPLVLALAVAFVLALGLRVAAPRAVAATPLLRPPSRGPPLPS